MNAFLAILKKELRSITREMTILIAIVIQLFIASFSSALLIGLLSVYDPESISANPQTNLRVGVVTDDFNTPLVRYLQDHNLTVNLFVNTPDAHRAFENHILDAIFIAPDDTGETMNLQMLLPRSETFASFVLLILREPLKRYENFLRQERGAMVNYTDIPGLPDTTFQFLYSVIIPMLMLFPAFVAGSQVIDSTSEELETLYFAPLSLNTIFAAKIFAAFVIAIAQCALWLALLHLNRVDIPNIGLAFLLATLVAAINIILSAFAATALRDRERSQFVYSLFIVFAASASYFFDAAPIQTLTRLATGDYYTGIADVAKYAVGLVILFAIFFRTTKRLAAV